ncbi:MAG: arylsulfatase, partial [Bacteroidales bacterium]|nr:arylsulfatase [Bacteroidales bacterium]
DIMPTLLSLTGSSIPPGVQGRDLSSLFLTGEGERPKAALYLRNVNGEPGPDGLYRQFFPVARGLKTDRYTFEIALRRDRALREVKIYDDLEDPYQLHNLDYREHRELFDNLCTLLSQKLSESADVWDRENILDKILEQL